MRCLSRAVWLARPVAAAGDGRTIDQVFVDVEANVRTLNQKKDLWNVRIIAAERDGESLLFVLV